MRPGEREARMNTSEDRSINFANAGCGIGQPRWKARSCSRFRSEEPRPRGVERSRPRRSSNSSP